MFPIHPPKRPGLDPDAHGTPGSASAMAPPPPTEQVSDMRRPQAFESPLSVRAGLRLVNLAEPAHRLPGDTLAMEQLAQSAQVELQLGAELVQRLFALWNGLTALEADEIGDWALGAQVHIQCAPGQPLPPVIAVGATVYASGEVAFSLQFEGFDAPLWLDEQPDLSALSEP